MNNWHKISKVIYSILDNFSHAIILDIGCNMGLYAFEMEKYKSTSLTGIDLEIKKALFFQKYIRENKEFSFKAKFYERDITKEKAPIKNCDIITMFCTLYHLSPNEDVVKNLPDHDYIILQGNKKRLNSKKRR